MAMTETKRKRIVYAVFIVAVIWGLYNQPWKRPQRTIAADPVPAAATVASVTAEPSDGAMLSGGTAVADWRIDPFRPIERNDTPAYAAPVVDDHVMPVLKGTMVVGGRRLCVLDNRVYRTGQRAGDWKVVTIDQGKVMIQGPAGQTVELVAADRETGE